MTQLFEDYLKNHQSYLYIKKISQITGKSFAETLDSLSNLPRKYKNKLKEIDPNLITTGDLEEIVTKTKGGEETIKKISYLNVSDKEKANILSGYLEGNHSTSYLESLLKAFQSSGIVPGVNAGVVETQQSGSSMGYDDFITPELRDLARLLYGKKAKNNRSQGRLKKIYLEELRRLAVRTVNSKNPEEALREVNKIKNKIFKWIKNL